MANQLRMATVQTVLTLHRQGWSHRRIARELGIHRETVARYVRMDQEGAIPAHPPSGADPPKPANAPLGSDASKPANAPPGSAGRISDCTPFHEVILEKLALGLSSVRIHQDLIAEHAADLSYHSVKRYCRRLKATTPLPFRRLECAPGEEAQVDFGAGAPVIQPDGKRRRTHVFRIVLSHSRKAYSEAVYRQTTEDFIRCLENAFHHFGGTPQTLVIDNLKAAVTKADWFDPELNPKIQSFCAHYDMVILPTRPRTPRHKGKVERGVDYVQNNALKGRTFTSLAEQNRHLLAWETGVADTRIHGTTREQVRKAFEREKPALHPLPVARFACFHEARRKVNRDGHVEVDKAYYSAPPEYLCRSVWVRWDSRVVRIFNGRFEQIAIPHETRAGSVQHGESTHPHAEAQRGRTRRNVPAAPGGPDRSAHRGLGGTDGSSARDRRRPRADGIVEPGQATSGRADRASLRTGLHARSLPAADHS
jgi:transposase